MRTPCPPSQEPAMGVHRGGFGDSPLNGSLSNVLFDLFLFLDALFPSRSLCHSACFYFLRPSRHRRTRSGFSWPQSGSELSPDPWSIVEPQTKTASANGN